MVDIMKGVGSLFTQPDNTQSNAYYNAQLQEYLKQKELEKQISLAQYNHQLAIDEKGYDAKASEREALASFYEKQGNLLAAAQIRAGGKVNSPQQDYTLGQGQVRYNPMNQEVASVPKADTTPSVVRTHEYRQALSPEEREQFDYAAKITTPGSAQMIQQGKEQGKLDAGFANSVGEKITELEYASSLVDELLKNKDGLDRATGFAGMFDTVNTWTSQPYRDFMARKEQLSGMAYLMAREKLKGTGQITEKEADKAEQSYQRMMNATSEREFTVAAQEFKSQMMNLSQTMRRRAKQKGIPVPDPQQAPTTGFSIRRID